jgi:hypothetical protein
MGIDGLEIRRRFVCFYPGRFEDLQDFVVARQRFPGFFSRSFDNFNNDFGDKAFDDGHFNLQFCMVREAGAVEKRNRCDSEIYTKTRELMSRREIRGELKDSA